MTMATRTAPGRMPVIPGSFAYHRPTSIKEAVGLLARLGDEGRALAGGHSLIPMMKLRLATPANLVDLAGIAELKGARSDGNDIVIGAMTTQHDLAGSELLGRQGPDPARDVAADPGRPRSRRHHAGRNRDLDPCGNRRGKAQQAFARCRSIFAVIRFNRVVSA